MNIPPPVKSDRSGELEEVEYDFILNDCLSEKRRYDETVLRYIDSFVRCKNNLQASQECGIDRALGYRIKNYKDVSLAINKLTQRSAVKYGFDASEVMERTKEIADFDPIMVQNPDGTFKNNFHDIPAEARRCIKKLKVKNLWGQTEDINGIKTKIIIGEVIEYEFHDKMKAIDMVGKEKEMFKTTNKVEHTVSNDMASLLLASVERGKKASENIIDITPESVEDV